MKVNLNTNESGFTLLESLIALLVSSVILLFLHSTILQLRKMNELVIEDAQTVSSSASKVTGSRQIEWHLFLAQLEYYLEDTELLEYNSQELIVNEREKEENHLKRIVYGQALTGNQNFYRRNNNGYNEMLTDILSYQIKVLDDCLHLSFTFRNQEEYKGRIWVESWKEREEKPVSSNQKKAI